jgi:hypothetical protein
MYRPEVERTANRCEFLQESLEGPKLPVARPLRAAATELVIEDDTVLVA